MKTLYLDCFAGISGDMFLGAMVDLGVPFETLKAELTKLGLDHEFEIEMRRDEKLGIFGTKVDVIDLNASHSHDHTHDHTHEHENHHHDHDHNHGDSHTHEHENHHHDHDHNHGDSHTHEHEHHHHDHDHNHGDSHTHGHEHHHDHLRNFADIKGIIEGSTLSKSVKEKSLKIFELIAIAEGHVHGKPSDEVHFHEVGAIDSIVDIVGAAICLEVLEVDEVLASSIEVGEGFVKCAHGLMPVPAPATAEILSGVPILSKVKGYEMTTPTGAAIIKAIVSSFPSDKAMRIEKLGYGLGTRNLNIPNVLRAAFIESKVSDAKAQWILETNIDDMSSELLVYAEERLLAEGALDVYKTQIIMKKGRPAIKLSVLVKSTDMEKIQRVIFEETTSIGLRKYPVDKVKLDRTYEKIETKYGQVTLKTAMLDGEIVNIKPEYEDCKRLAIENKVPIAKVYRAIDELKR